MANTPCSQKISTLLVINKYDHTPEVPRLVETITTKDGKVISVETFPDPADAGETT